MKRILALIPLVLVFVLTLAIGSQNGQLTLGQMNALNHLYDREARSAQAL
jgi:uncharacterized membrane protein YciS (DUF1049 family)